MQTRSLHYIRIIFVSLNQTNCKLKNLQRIQEPRENDSTEIEKVRGLLSKPEFGHNKALKQALHDQGIPRRIPNVGGDPLAIHKPRLMYFRRFPLPKRETASHQFYGYLVTTFASSRGPVLTEPIRLSLNRTSFRCNDGRCVQKAGTYSPCDDDTRILGAPCSRGRFQTSIPTANRFGGPLLLSESLLIVLSIVMRV